MPTHLLQLRVLSLLLLTIFLGVSGRALAETPAERLQRLIQELDHDEFSTRDRATDELLALGTSALPALREAAQKGSPEVRFRARHIINVTFHADMVARFTKLGAARDEDIDLEEGMWLIARIVDPAVDLKEIQKQLDDLAKQVRDDFPQGVDLSQLPAAKAVDAVCKVLFEDVQFTGNTTDYRNPKNSALHHVLKSRQGLPILLSHVVVSVAQRLKIPIVGVGVPGRYMCKYDLSRAPDKRTEEIIINPFEAGQLLTAEMLQKAIPGLNPAIHLQASTHRSTLIRMLSNLASHARYTEQPVMAARAEAYKLLLDVPEPAPESP